MYDIASWLCAVFAKGRSRDVGLGVLENLIVKQADPMKRLTKSTWSKDQQDRSYGKIIRLMLPTILILFIFSRLTS